MMEQMIELKKHTDGQHSLVLWQNGMYLEYVVCSHYDATQPMGSRWSWGHYFNDIDDALEYLNNIK